MEERIVIYDIVRSNLVGSRYYAEIIRETIYQHIQMGKKIVLDFENIDLITQSFADELIGILVRAFGVDFVKANISVINANKTIRKILNVVVSYSRQLQTA